MHDALAAAQVLYLETETPKLVICFEKNTLRMAAIELQENENKFNN